MDVAEHGGEPTDPSALARLAAAKADAKSYEESLRALKNVLRTSMATEKRLDEALQETVANHNKETFQLQKSCAEKANALAHQVIEHEIQLMRLRSNMKQQGAMEPCQLDVEDMAMEVFERMRLRESTLRHEHDKMHEDKQRHVKLMTRDYTEVMTGIEKEAEHLRVKIKEQAAVNAHYLKSLNGKPHDPGHAGKYSPLWLVGQLGKALDQLASHQRTLEHKRNDKMEIAKKIIALRLEVEGAKVDNVRLQADLLGRVSEHWEKQLAMEELQEKGIEAGEKEEKIQRVGSGTSTGEQISTSASPSREGGRPSSAVLVRDEPKELFLIKELKRGLNSDLLEQLQQQLGRPPTGIWAGQAAVSTSPIKGGGGGKKRPVSSSSVSSTCLSAARTAVAEGGGGGGVTGGVGGGDVESVQSGSTRWGEGQGRGRGEGVGMGSGGGELDSMHRCMNKKEEDELSRCLISLHNQGAYLEQIMERKGVSNARDKIIHLIKLSMERGAHDFASHDDEGRDKAASSRKKHLGIRVRPASAIGLSRDVPHQASGRENVSPAAQSPVHQLPASAGSPDAAPGEVLAVVGSKPRPKEVKKGAQRKMGFHSMFAAPKMAPSAKEESAPVHTTAARQWAILPPSSLALDSIYRLPDRPASAARPGGESFRKERVRPASAQGQVIAGAAKAAPRPRVLHPSTHISMQRNLADDTGGKRVARKVEPWVPSVSWDRARAVKPGMTVDEEVAAILGGYSGLQSRTGSDAGAMADTRANTASPVVRVTIQGVGMVGDGGEAGLSKGSALSGAPPALPAFGGSSGIRIKVRSRGSSFSGPVQDQA